MRTREFITEEYLASLLETLRPQISEYTTYTEGLWLHKDSEAIHHLQLALEPYKDERRIPLAHYHHILNALHQAYEKSEHKDHHIMQLLHEFVLTELQSLREANWQNPAEHETASSSIKNALNQIGEHACFRSQQDEEFAEKWDVSVSVMNVPHATELWQTFCSGQKWHIKKNHDHEVTIAAELELGVHNNTLPDFFIMQTSDQVVTELEKDLYELRNARSKTMGTLNRDLHALQNSADTAKDRKDYAAQTQFKHDVHNKQQEKLDYDKEQQELIDDKIREIQLRRLELSHQINPDSKLTPSARLEEYYYQLSLWTPRNLSLLFLENIIDAQIRLLSSKNTADMDDNVSNTDMQDMIHHLGHSMQVILEAVNRARTAIKRELNFYQDIIKAHPGDASHHLRSFTPSFLEIDPEQASKEFIEYASKKLLAYTTSEQMKKASELKQQMRYYPFGVTLPDPDRVIAEVKAANEAKENAKEEAPAAAPETSTNPPEAPATPPEANQPAPGLRRSSRIHSSLDQLGQSPAPAIQTASNPADAAAAAVSAPGANPPPNNTAPVIAADIQRARPIQRAPRRDEYSLGVKILIGIGIALALGIFIAGGVTAVVFSGGTVGLALAVGVVAALSGTAVIGGVMTSCQRISQRNAELNAIAARRAVQGREFDRDIHHRPPGSGSNAGYAPLPQDAPPLSVPAALPAASPGDALRKNSLFALPPVTSQPALVLPDAQNQGTPTASTPSAIRR